MPAPAVALGLLVVLAATLPTVVLAQAVNGKLQIHFMNVDQGDGAILISPKGETVLFDDGLLYHCDLPVSYLQQLGITQIDYHICSHYHADHYGCAREIFTEFPLQKHAYDRGHSSTGPTYNSYAAAVGTKRKTATSSTVITLDAAEPSPVKVKIVALNANGISSNNENDKSVVAVVEFGNFSAEIGGDLSGYNTTSYKDIETSVAPKVGKVDVYKVHHHGSEHSTNETWLQTIEPTIAVISSGETNSHGHPTEGCLGRLHGAGIRTFWTTRGNGAPPDPTFDTVCGNVIVEAEAGASTFTITCDDGHSETFSSVPGGVITPVPTPPPATGDFAWSKRSDVYHFAECSYVQNISSWNLQTGTTAPAGKRLHDGCPR